MALDLNPEHPVLLVDDEANALESFSIALRFLGIRNVIKCQNETAVMDILAREDVEIILLDLVMPKRSGESLLEEIVQKYPDIPVMMVTGIGDVRTAVRCMSKGAFDYLTKPVDNEQLASSLKRALDFRLLKRKNDLLVHHLLTDSLKSPQAFKSIITQNRKMLSLFMYCEAIAPGNEPVLITGETGVGKELFARATHLAGKRPGEFVPVNVAGVDDHVFSDTLFGHKRGAFTGALDTRKGLIEKAARGTIFLDEIGDLGESSQIKLLRVLQDREYFPLGSDEAHAVRARIIVATNKELRQLNEGGALRQDLFYRLRTHHLQIPALRERPEDIPLLLDYYIEEAAREFRKPVPTYPAALPQLLTGHYFPGNVRELRAMVYDAVGKHVSRVMSMRSFRDHIIENSPSFAAPYQVNDRIYESLPKLPTIKEAINSLVKEVMQRTGGNQRVASGILGITPSGLNKRLNAPDYKGKDK